MSMLAWFPSIRSDWATLLFFSAQVNVAGALRSASLGALTQCVTGEFVVQPLVSTGNTAELGHSERTRDVGHRVVGWVCAQQIGAELAEESIPEVSGRGASSTSTKACRTRLSEAQAARHS
jgi:hypothetical protein